MELALTRIPETPAAAPASAPLAPYRSESRPRFLPGPIPPSSLPAKYEPVRVIGTGAVGTVLLARDKSLGRLVAIKTLRTDCGDLLGRLRREASVLARLDHPSIVRVHELDVHAGHLFLAMEYVAGGNLALARLAPVPLVRKLRGVVDALAHAHAQGVLHRDVKPENILLTSAGETGRAVLADFGLALGAEEGSPTLRRPVVGTPLTMSPEQIAGAELGPTSDVFSLGVTLYRQLTGVWPFRGRTVPDVFDAIRDQEVERLRPYDRTIPRRLDAIVRRALAKLPVERFESMHELGRALDSVQRGRSLFSFVTRRIRSGARASSHRIHPEDQR